MTMIKVVPNVGWCCPRPNSATRQARLNAVDAMAWVADRPLRYRFEARYYIQWKCAAQLATATSNHTTRVTYWSLQQLPWVVNEMGGAPHDSGTVYVTTQ
jgi:hypothetical protein